MGKIGIKFPCSDCYMIENDDSTIVLCVVVWPTLPTVQVKLMRIKQRYKYFYYGFKYLFVCKCVLVMISWMQFEVLAIFLTESCSCYHIIQQD